MAVRLAAVLLLATTLAACTTACTGDGGDTEPPAGPPPATSTTFRNPLLSRGPDPWVIRHEGFYYVLHTTGNEVRIYKTARITDLPRTQPVTVWTPPSTGPNSRNIWAPELHRLDNKWYIYYTAGSSSDLGTQRTFVLENTAADPTTGAWTSRGRIYNPTTDEWAIDGTVFEQNGKRYFAWSGQPGPGNTTQCLYLSEMTNPWTLTGPRIELSCPTYDWEKIGDPLPDVNEGPQFLRRGERMFIIYSASGCWTDQYALGMLHASSTADPAVPANWTKVDTAVFRQRPEAFAYGTGHNSFFQSPDGTEDWIMYHANPAPNQACENNRSPRIQRFTWRPDGFPNFGRPVSLNDELPKPSGE